MAKLPNSFQEVDASDEPLPAGDYLAEVIKTDLKDSKSGGKYILYVFKVLEGPKKGSTVLFNVNVVNDNVQAVEIGKRMNNKLCEAVGVNPNKKDLDSDEVKNIPLIITVTVRPADSAHPGNDIKAFKKASAAGAPKKNPFAR